MNEQHFISEVCVKWQKDIDNAILGEIKQKAIDNGIKTEYVLNEKAIISALEKQIPKKPTSICGRYWGKAKSGKCPFCQSGVNSMQNNFCSKCGQAIDWSDTK